MTKRQPPLPRIWLVTDARNDAVLENVLLRLPRGSGLIFRHYHLEGSAPCPRRPGLDPGTRWSAGSAVEPSGTPGQARGDDGGRRRRFNVLKRIARRKRHVVALSANASTARRWGAHAAYGSSRHLVGGPAMLRLITAHSLREIAQARRARASAILLSPVFQTPSHPGGKVLGPLRFRLLAARCQIPVIALGGMTVHRAGRLKAAHWAAIDGLCAS